jgi:hypothetical protein
MVGGDLRVRIRWAYIRGRERMQVAIEGQGRSEKVAMIEKNGKE